MNAAVSEETKALVENLRIKAAMIDFGEKIEWGSDAALMREAATFIESLATPVPGAVSNAMVERARKAADDAWMKWTGGRSPLDGMHFFVRAALEAAVQSVGVREATDDQT